MSNDSNVNENFSFNKIDKFRFDDDFTISDLSIASVYNMKSERHEEKKRQTESLEGVVEEEEKDDFVFKEKKRFSV